MGESYAGVYIVEWLFSNLSVNLITQQPYIVRALFSTPNPPVTLKKFAIGDGAIGSQAVAEQLPTVSVLETYPQLINYDVEVYEYFKSQ